MAVKIYSLKSDGEKFCSKYTKVKEMRSKDGSDKILIDDILMAMIDKLYDTLNCSKYVITSGYRTSSHDKGVGGNGYGQHTKGKAVDCYFYDATGNVIPSKEVACIAQDIGFKGIANINTKYQAIHLDMRTSGTYKGDEVFGTKTVTKDFYAYYGIDATKLKLKYGLIKVGWQQDEKGGWRYQNADETYPINQWLKLDAWYYFDKKGYAIQNDWQKIKDKWYYFDDNCRMVTGLQTVNGKLYYLADDGHLCYTDVNGVLK